MMAGVYSSSPTNSTCFTECCHVAICDDESVCPQCKAEVTPRSPRGRHEMTMIKMYGAERLAKMRSKYREAGRW